MKRLRIIGLLCVFAAMILAVFGIYVVLGTTVMEFRAAFWFVLLGGGAIVGLLIVGIVVYVFGVFAQR